MKLFYFQDCCDTIQVEQDEENEDLSKHQSRIFTSYLKQKELHDGRVHYLSTDGKNLIAYYRAERLWVIQMAENRLANLCVILQKHKLITSLKSGFMSMPLPEQKKIASAQVKWVTSGSSTMKESGNRPEKD